MAKRDEMLAKLKAAAIRRERRGAAMPKTPASSTPTSCTPSSGPSVDVIGAIVEVITESCTSSDSRLDAVVVTALRAQLKQIEPPREQARILYARLNGLRESLAQQHPEMTQRHFRSAIQQLLDEATNYGSANPHSSRFIEFLEVFGR